MKIKNCKVCKSGDIDVITKYLSLYTICCNNCLAATKEYSSLRTATIAWNKGKAKSIILELEETPLKGE